MYEDFSRLLHNKVSLSFNSAILYCYLKEPIPIVIGKKCNIYIFDVLILQFNNNTYSKSSRGR